MVASTKSIRPSFAAAGVLRRAAGFSAKDAVCGHGGGAKIEVQKLQPLRPYTMLKAGGLAENLVICRKRDELAEAALEAFAGGDPVTVLGYGSNVLVSDRGIPGLTIVNRTAALSFTVRQEWEADSGIWLQDLLLKTAQTGWGGLDFAVGIPGSLGGALVSNAGAYRSSIETWLTELEIVTDRGREWVSPSWMGFSYRDSRLRRNPNEKCVLLAARLHLRQEFQADIYRRAKEFQVQRIHKQPTPASAGSFFKNIYDIEFAKSIRSLPKEMKLSGVVPAGRLIERCRLKGYRRGRCSIGTKHANFILNDRGATALEIRTMADYVKSKVYRKFGKVLEEEVLYVGDWSHYKPWTPDSCG